MACRRTRDFASATTASRWKELYLTVQWRIVYCELSAYQAYFSAGAGYGLVGVHLLQCRLPLPGAQIRVHYHFSWAVVQGLAVCTLRTYVCKQLLCHAFRGPMLIHTCAPTFLKNNCTMYYVIACNVHLFLQALTHSRALHQQVSSTHVHPADLWCACCLSLA